MHFTREGFGHETSPVQLNEDTTAAVSFPASGGGTHAVQNLLMKILAMGMLLAVLQSLKWLSKFLVHVQWDNLMAISAVQMRN